MTKRFTNVNEDIFQYGEWYCSAKSEHCADVIATALNMVTEENEQLKQTIDRLTLDNTKQKKVLNATKKENEQLKKELNIPRDAHFMNRGELIELNHQLATINNKREKENEQLKKQNENLQNLIDALERQLKICEYGDFKYE